MFKNVPVYRTEQSSTTRFRNYVYCGDELVGCIHGGLKYQIAFATTLKDLLTRTEEVKNTSELRYQPYVTETKIEEEIIMNKEITMVSKGNLMKEKIRAEAIKLCNAEGAVDEIMRAKAMKSLIQGVIKESVMRTAKEVAGMKKVFIRFKEDGYNYDVIILGASEMVLYENEIEQKDVEELFDVSVKEIYNIDGCVYLGYEEIIVA